MPEDRAATALGHAPDAGGQERAGPSPGEPDPVLAPGAPRLALAAVAAAGGLALVVARARAGVALEPVAWEAAAQVVGAATLLLRREAVALAVCLALCLVSPVLATPVALYLVARWAGPRAAWLGLVAALLMVWPVWQVTAFRTGVAVPLLLLLDVLVPWLAGRGQRSAAHAAVLRVAQERAAAEAAALAVRRAERTRLAGELHDVVAHRISLIVLHANLLDAATDDPAVHAAAGEIRDTGRAALDEMREVLRLLRRDPGEDGLARHALPEVEGLVAAARDVGQPVTAVVAAAHRDPPDPAERTAVRVVREGLTNAVRHAPGAGTRVLVEDAGPELHVQVLTTEARSVPTGLTTGGTGLAGLRERVALVGGRLDAGPTPAGGFLLDARLPRRATPA
ncbi:sensor histidine kinase [Cellulomonas sp. GbtcB1]|uniref:sensor histidine kinase n=1 Tax=Cellulomonas sp. GbtcB1 TaxID=2824746 RepID=UPI001C2FCFAB|nr:histidine kinase [Cellulomonas sp. GbtcB1]